MAYDPYAKDNEWTAKASDGTEYTGAEVTSEGFQIFGLPPYQYYSAGLACYMAGPDSNNWMQDNHDVWNNSMDLAGIQNGGIVGFKYFGFGGLDKDDRGVKAFNGTKVGDNTQICLNLTPGGHGAFKIRIMLDAPYNNNAWNGREIAVINVPATASKESMLYTVDVPAVEGLTGKHAIYLVVEGPEVEQPKNNQPQWARRPLQPQRPEGLFTLHGIGFSKTGATCTPPIVPTLTITADGQKLALPDTPIRATNQNGYTDCSHYQVYAPLKANSQLKVSASSPDVKTEISTIVEGRATIKCTYQGKTKTYLIN